MRKTAAIILALALACATLAACTVNAPAPAPAPEPSGQEEPAQEGTDAPAGDVVVNFITWRGEDSTVFKDLIAMFEDENPGIKVNLEITSADITEYYTVLRTRFTSDSADVFNIHPGTYLAEWAVAGMIMDLAGTGLPELYEDDYLGVGQVDGIQYGLLTTYNSCGVYYNKKIFGELGLSEPRTYGELKAVCDAVSEAGYLTIAAGFGEGWCLDMILEPLVCNYAPTDPMAYRKLETGELKLADEPFVSVLRDIDRMNQDGIFMTDVNGTSYDASISLFATEQAAMLLCGTWSIGGLKEMDDTLDFDIFPLPGVSAEPAAPIMPSQAISINPNSKVMDAALKFAAFLSSAEGEAYYCNNTAQSSTVKGVVSDAPEISMVQKLMSGKTAEWPDTYLTDSRMFDILDELASKIIGGAEVDVAAAEAQALIDSEVVPNAG